MLSLCRAISEQIPDSEIIIVRLSKHAQNGMHGIQIVHACKMILLSATSYFRTITPY